MVPAVTGLPAYLAQASAKIGALGSAFYFDPATLARGKELGLDGFRFYILGRGGVLGDVDASVIVSAFGYFAPEMMRTRWDQARAILDPRTAALEYFASCAAFGRARLSQVADLEGLCDALGAINDAADPAGLALYAGIAAEPLASDPPARAMQLVTVLREYRGSAHLAAIVASTLEPRIAHFMRRPEMYSFFGYSDDRVPEVTDEHRAKLAAADENTDRIVARAYGVLDEARGDALVRGLAAIEAELA
jgi:hypothetical protein